MYILICTFAILCLHCIYYSIILHILESSFASVRFSFIFLPASPSPAPVPSYVLHLLRNVIAEP